MMLFQMPLYSQSNASFVDLMFIYFSWVIILLFCNASLLQVKLVLLFLFRFRTKLKCLGFSKCLCTQTKKRFCCSFFLTSLRGCVKVLFFFFSSLPLRTSLPALLLMNSSSDFLCRLVFFYLQVPIAMLSSDFSFEFALLRVSSDSALPSFLFRFSFSECLFRLSLRLPPLRF